MPLGIIITTDKQVTLRDIDGLADMQDIVGGLIEPISMGWMLGHMYVNEEGMYREECTFNSIASDVMTPYVYNRGGYMPILGNAFILGALHPNGWHHDVSHEMRAWVCKVARDAGGTITNDMLLPRKKA